MIQSMKEIAVQTRGKAPEVMEISTCIHGKLIGVIKIVSNKNYKYHCGKVQIPTGKLDFKSFILV